MLYDREGRATIAATLEQHDRLKSDGWERKWPRSPCIGDARCRITASSASTTMIPHWRTIREVIEAVLDERDLSDFVAR